MTEIQCPKCDYKATGNNQEEAMADLKEHAKSAHNIDDIEHDQSFMGMMEGMKTKITGMLKK
jgi:predicted small metal-binding protein